MRDNVDEMKKWIDNATYEQLLRRWRFSPAGDPFFNDTTGVADYYIKVMNKKKDELGNCKAVDISKKIGWDK